MDGKHMVLQAQARFLLNKGDLEGSEKAIKEAIEIHQGNFAFHCLTLWVKSGRRNCRSMWRRMTLRALPMP